MTKASDNDYPSILLTEQSSAPSSPASGKQRAYIRTSDHTLVTVNSSGTVAAVGGGGSGFTPAFAIYRRTSGNYTTTSSTFVDIDATNLSFTITTGARRVRCVLDCTASINAASEAVAYEILVDGTAKGGGTGGYRYSSGAAANHQPVHIEYLSDVLSAGSHTFKWQWRTSNGFTGTIRGGTTAPDAPLLAYVEETAITT
jgi:hypothetical protein